MAVLAGKQAKLDDVLVVLTEAQIKTQEGFGEMREGFVEMREGFREVKERFRETDLRFRETDIRFRQLEQDLRRLDQEGRERAKYFDERVDNLVSAIGEFLRRGEKAPPAPPTTPPESTL